MDIRDLKAAFNAKAHPVVVDGRTTESQAYNEFCETFDQHHPAEAGVLVTFAEFADYYTNVSAVVESDAFFQQLLTATWALNREAPKQRPVSAYNFRPKNHGNQRFFSGKESHENTIGQSTRYYEQR